MMLEGVEIEDPNTLWWLVEWLETEETIVSYISQ